MNYFEKLNNINVNDKTEDRSGLTYLAWAWAWGELKKQYPLSYYTIYENAEGLFYHTDGKTCWVKTGVTVVDGEWKLEHIEYLPVMDYRNKSIPLDNITSFDVNKAIQRSLTKAVARHGLGLYIYAGEDLPEVERAEEAPKKVPKKVPANIVKHRNNELKALLTEKGKTMEDYKSLAGDKTVSNMTAQEYLDWFKELKATWS
jgi:hypothetical protein